MTMMNYLLLLPAVIVAVTSENALEDSVHRDKRQVSEQRFLGSFDTGCFERPKCLANGRTKDPANCRNFAMCTDVGTPKETYNIFTCGPLLIYNEDKKTCDWPDTVSIDQRCTCGELGGGHPCEAEPICVKEGNMINPKNCKNFISCVNYGTPVERQYILDCPEDLVYNHETDACDYYRNIGEARCLCGEFKNVTIDSFISKTRGTPKPPQTTRRTTTGMTTPTTASTTSYRRGGSRCTRKPVCTDNGIIPDPRNCQSFIQCLFYGTPNERQQEFHCSGDLVYNSRRNACDHYKPEGAVRCRCGEFDKS